MEKVKKEQSAFFEKKDTDGGGKVIYCKCSVFI